MPRCLKNGFFAPVQCHGSTGICWCVDKNGDIVSDAQIKKTACSKYPLILYI